MLKAEKSLPKKNVTGWSPKLRVITNRIRYLRLSRRRLKGIKISDVAMASYQEKAETDFVSRDCKEINEELQASWKDMKEYKKNTMVER